MKPTGGPSALLARVLQALRPLVRLLVHHGITYTALAAALKPLFLDEARRELQRRGMPATDSALTLLSGVHRRDVRTLTREPRTTGAADAVVAAAGAPVSMGLASEVVGRWMGERRWLDRRGQARLLPRAAQARDDEPSFDELVESVSRDVRPRAVLDELVRLGVAEETSEGVRLLAEGFAPKRGFDEMAALFAANLHDHAAAAVANLRGDANFLEQAVFVDELGEDSVHELALAAKAAWQAALRDVLAKARERFDADQARPRTERCQRARFGAYFYSETEE